LGGNLGGNYLWAAVRTSGGIPGGRSATDATLKPLENSNGATDDICSVAFISKQESNSAAAER
jgi:hypothetical protein